MAVKYLQNIFEILFRQFFKPVYKKRRTNILGFFRGVGQNKFQVSILNLMKFETVYFLGWLECS